MEQFKKIPLILLLIKFTHQTGKIGDAEAGCKILWDNTCLKDNECCSSYCFRESHWAQGVCKPKELVGQIPTPFCKSLWDNSCIADNECCSSYCFKGLDWRQGVCKLREPTAPSTGPPPTFTVPMRPTRPTLPTLPTCKQVGDNSCWNHWDCCSQYCHKNFGPNEQYSRGTCKPRPRIPVQTTTVPTTSTFENCGQVNITPTVDYRSRSHSLRIESIIGGDDASFGTHPWQVLLLRKTGPTWNPICGGALINDKWVLTAGHCVHNYPPTDYLARIGEWDKSVTDEELPHEDFEIELIKVHPRFRNVNPTRNDIALIKLKLYVEFKPNMLPICLPSSHIQLLGRKAVVAGWGVTETGSKSQVLKEVEVDIISDDLCREWYKLRTAIGEEFFCAGYQEGKKDTCQGDSGGPLSVEVNNTRMLVGIASFGYRCGQEKFPGVYTNVSYFSGWIEDEIKRGNSYVID